VLFSEGDPMNKKDFAKRFPAAINTTAITPIQKHPSPNITHT